MKNLSVNTAASNRPSSSQLPKLGMTGPVAAPAPSHAFSAPPTPAFIVPPKAPRRKPSNLGLTLATPESGTSNSQDRPTIVPQTPSDPQIQTLRLLQTSSSGPLFSPTLAPEGGMRLPPYNNTASSNQFGKVGPPLSISPSSMSSPIKKQTLEHVQEESDYDVPLSQEVKSPAYPQGPVCIYDPNVYLYLEPSRVEAREFDVVLNVAREVKNPFDGPEIATSQSKTADKGVQASFDTADKGIQVSFEDLAQDDTEQSKEKEPWTAASEFSYRSALEPLTDDNTTTAPSTPKAIKPEPEYIHIPWDHNTNVVKDLLRLCELIDERVRQRKRVLIHCQCGVSRSASLVVAYGLYKNPQITVQEAYDTVKNRSRWIGPNMNLIYQLSEFKSQLQQQMTQGAQTWHTWRALGSERPNLNLSLKPDSRLGALAPSAGNTPKESGRGRSQTEVLSCSAPVVSYNPPASAQLTASSRIGNVTPGPLSAPPNYQGPLDDAKISESTDTVVNSAALPEQMDVDTQQISDQGATYQELIQEKEFPPIGAVASDLREVAKDLDQTDKTSSVSAALVSMDPDSETKSIAPPGRWPAEDSNEPQAKPKPSISDLPIGFSSLRTRRQGLQSLPLRQEPPCLAASHTTPAPFNPIVDDVPPTPSLLSPRAAEFTASPFHRTAAGDLAGSSVFEQSLMSPKAVNDDPRSPHQRGEAPITRSIFEMI